MWKYEYRKQNEAGGFRKVDTKDFKRLNKKVLQEGATNAAVSTTKSLSNNETSDILSLFSYRLTVHSEPTLTTSCNRSSQPAAELVQEVTSTFLKRSLTAALTDHRPP